MRREVAVVGVGLHKWGLYPEKSILDMCAESVLAAMKDANNLSWKQIQLIAAGCWPWAGRGSPGLTIGNQIANRLGETGAPIINLYGACATPIMTMREASNAIASGECDIALAMAADKSPGGFFRSTYEHPSDAYYTRLRMCGISNPAFWAMWARRRMYEVGTTPWHFAMVKSKNSEHASLNPNARYRKVYSVEEVLNSNMVVDPLTLFEICATSDGAAAAVLCAMDIAHKYNSKPIKVAAATTGTSYFGDPTPVIPYLCRQAKKTAPLHSEIVSASKRAFKMSGLQPADLDVLELHDACTYHELAYLEAIMDLQPGEADRMLEKGETKLSGKLPINPSGGASSWGEALSAQGIGQVCELVWQLRGEAGERQVKGAKRGLGQTYGAYGNASICILEKGY